MSTQTIPLTKTRFATPEEVLEEEQRERFQQVRLEKLAQTLTNVIPALKIKEDFQNALARNGAAPEDVARCLGDTMNEATATKDRLRAAELVMKSFGLLDSTNNSSQTITFNIQGDSVNMQAVLQPNRERQEN